jgi:ATP-dependent helicase HrpB
MTSLPIEYVLDNLNSTLKTQNRVLVVAPPGAGKSTLLPLSLLTSDSVKTDSSKHGEIWLLEPRRVAAEQVARRLADTLGEDLGEHIGLITGDFSKTGKNNRIIVMTEGVLTQKLLHNNEIPECSTIIFDEFHERSLPSDLGLAMAVQCQEYLREDLKLIIMSATLDCAALIDNLDAALIESEGKSYPVENIYVIKQAELSLEQNISKLIQRAYKEHHGDILVFLPGVREISRTHDLLKDSLTSAASILPLHGQLPNKEQQHAIRPSSQSNHRKIILATDIAKTSLTIDGVTVVIDSCMERQARFNSQTAMDELITVQASQASMIQRAGRAGRTQAGQCYRLLSEEAFHTRPPFSQSAIQLSDLTPFSLTLGAWGSFDLNDYILLDKPELKRYENSLNLLNQLNAIDTHQENTQTISNHGKKLSEFSVHPRLANMLLSIQDSKLVYSACLLAAILTEGDPLYFYQSNSDLTLRLELFKEMTSNSNIPKRYEGGEVKYNLTKRILKLTHRLAKKLKVKDIEIRSEKAGILCMLAFPDRIAQKRGNGYRLRSGQGVQVLHNDALTHSDFLAVAHTSTQAAFNNSTAKQTYIRLGTKIEKTDIFQYFKEQITVHSRFEMQSQLMEIQEEKLGALTLIAKTTKAPESARLEFIVQEIRQSGLAFLPLKEDALTLLKKLNLAHELFPDIYPSFKESVLISDLDNWLTPFMKDGNLKNIPYSDALLSRIEWKIQTDLKNDFPSSLTLPSGRNAAIDYSENPPVAKGKLQEFFGMPISPTIAKGKITLNLHLLSPAQKPLAMTHDLAFFWKEAYPEVRKESRGRYAKHPWPENPLTAMASSKTKKRMENG